MTLKTFKTAFSLFFGLVCFSFLSACNSKSGANLGSSNLSQQPQIVSAPVQLGGRTTTGTIDPQAFSVQVPLEKGNVIRSIENYRINKKAPFGSYKYVGADLNGDGRAEVLVYLTGPEWCGITGCTLAILAPSNLYSYEVISTIRRVKKPITISPNRSNGWYDIYIRAGRADYPRSHKIVLKFNGSRYPGNAVRLTPLARSFKVQGDMIFQPSTAAEQALIRSYAAAN